MQNARRSLRDDLRRSTLGSDASDPFVPRDVETAYGTPPVAHIPPLTLRRIALAAEAPKQQQQQPEAAGRPQLRGTAPLFHRIGTANGDAVADGEQLQVPDSRVVSRVNSSRRGPAVQKSWENVLRGSMLGSGAVLAATARDPEGPEERPGFFALSSDLRAFWVLISSSWMNLLLLCVPLGIASGWYGWNSSLVFVSNFLCLIPLALMLGEITEDLAVRFGDTVGGLLNATFGNVVEMILSIAALRRELYTVVATSLIGSILSNLLLVLGMCFLFGGIRHKQQHFNALANKVSSSLLFLACIAIIIPSAAKLFYGGQVISASTVFNLSHAIAILLICMYMCYLFFQLRTHADCFSGEEDEDEPALSLSGAIGLLALITIIVAVNSEYLTGAIEAVSESSGLNQAFLGLIILPIAGNACEHITAVVVAMKNKMDLALGVALGSSIQIAIFVIPFTVLAGWVMGNDFTLDFDPFSVLMLTVSVILAYFVSSDGTSNWLLGLQLCGTYCLIALVFLLQQEPNETPSKAALGLS